MQKLCLVVAAPTHLTPTHTCVQEQDTAELEAASHVVADAEAEVATALAGKLTISQVRCWLALLAPTYSRRLQ